MSTLLKNKIVKKLNKIQWSGDNASSNSDLVFSNIIDALYEYLRTNYTFTGNFTGTHLIPLSPTPVYGTTTNGLYITNSTWLNTFKSIVRNGVAENGIQRIFTALQTILTGTLQATFSSLPLTIPPFISMVPALNLPVMPIIFPSISLFGNQCFLEIQGKKPNSIEIVWGIIAKYIQLALNINIISPIPTNGIIVSSVVGLTSSILTFN